MSAESAHLSTFGAETETEAEIRSTSNLNIPPPLPDIERVSQATLLGIDTYSLHLRICKQDAYANKSASLLTVTAEVARFEHSGTTHIIHRSYHVQDHVCVTCLCRSTCR